MMGKTSLALSLMLCLVPVPVLGQTPLSLKVAASDGMLNDYFGRSVALGGDLLVVGASGDDSMAPDGGAAYVFEREGSEWVERAKLESSEPVEDGFLGSAVATDGVTVAVAAVGDDELGTLAGAVLIYREVGGSWSFQQRLLPSDGSAFWGFGRSLVIAEDMLLVGASGDDSACPGDPTCSSGAVYVFEEVAGSWTEQGKIIPLDIAEGDLFGVELAVHGTVLVVGAPGQNANRGAVYVYEKAGGVWAEVQKLATDDPGGADSFGQELAIRADAIAVGVDFDDRAGTDTGSVYLFEVDEGIWTQSDFVTASDTFPSQSFGSQVAFVSETLAVGALGDEHSGVFAPGSVYLFRKSGATWVEEQKLIAAELRPGQRFGAVLASSATELAVGDEGPSTGAPFGSVYFMSEVFSDGFESGDTLSWSSTVP